MQKYEEFKKFFDELSSDNVGLLLDLGHLDVASHWFGFDKYDFIEKLKDKTFIIHVHENNGEVDQHDSIKEDTWCLEVIKRKCFNKLPIVLESYNNSIEEISDNLKLLNKVLMNKNA